MSEISEQATQNTPETAVSRFAHKKFKEAVEKGKIEGMAITKHQVNTRVRTSYYVMLKAFASMSDESISSLAAGLLEAAIVDYGKFYNTPKIGSEEWMNLYGEEMMDAVVEQVEQEV